MLGVLSVGCGVSWFRSVRVVVSIGCGCSVNGVYCSVCLYCTAQYSVCEWCVLECVSGVYWSV